MNELKRVLCNELIEKGIVKENDVIRHSYTNSRMRGEFKDIKENNICPTLDTRCDCLGVVVVDFVSKHYGNFIKENGYIPDMFNPYNESEIKDIAPAQTTQCGSTTSSSSILIKDDNMYSDYSIKKIKNNIINDDYVGAITSNAMQSFNHDNCHLVVEENEMEKDINVIGNYSPSGHNASRIVDSDGIAPTVKENHGTVTATNVYSDSENNYLQKMVILKDI